MAGNTWAGKNDFADVANDIVSALFRSLITSMPAQTAPENLKAPYNIVF